MRAAVLMRNMIWYKHRHQTSKSEDGVRTWSPLRGISCELASARCVTGRLFYVELRFQPELARRAKL